MLTTGVLFGTGDVIAQTFFPLHEPEDGKAPGLEGQRTMRAMIYGSCFFAPCGVLWYGRKLPSIKNPFISFQNRMRWNHSRVHAYDTVYRVAMDQLFVPGLVWIPMYNIVMSILAMHERPLEVAFHKLHNNWWNVLTSNWMVWPGFQLVSFFFVPVHLRVIAGNVFSVGWNCFLSYLFNSKLTGHPSPHIFDHVIEFDDEDHDIDDTMFVY